MHMKILHISNTIDLDLVTELSCQLSLLIKYSLSGVIQSLIAQVLPLQICV